MILLNYTDFCVFLFKNLVFILIIIIVIIIIIIISFLVVNSKHQYQLLQRSFSNFRAFYTKNDFYCLLDFMNVRAQLFLDRQFYLYFLTHIETTRLQQSIMFNLYSIATSNKHCFTVTLIIQIFAISHCATDIYR